jgi:hypothetical protein
MKLLNYRYLYDMLPFFRNFILSILINRHTAKYFNNDKSPIPVQAYIGLPNGRRDFFYAGRS